MPVKQHDKVRLTCPHCGHQQLEPSTAFSTNCRKCGQHVHVQEVLNPPPPKPKPKATAEIAPERRRVFCFECGAQLEVPPSAESTMCKRCSRYVDLKDYLINSAVSKNFKTRGAFVVEPKGYVFNTEAVVGDAVIKGRFLGKLVAERLTIYSTAEIKGTFAAGCLIVPAANTFRWKDPINISSGEIAGELVANVRAKGTVVLKSTARMFGDMEAKGIVVESGAVVVGKMKIVSE